MSPLVRLRLKKEEERRCLSAYIYYLSVFFHLPIGFINGCSDGRSPPQLYIYSYDRKIFTKC